jgi:hypothetical protein
MRAAWLAKRWFTSTRAGWLACHGVSAEAAVTAEPVSMTPKMAIRAVFLIFMTLFLSRSRSRGGPPYAVAIERGQDRKVALNWR